MGGGASVPERLDSKTVQFLAQDRWDPEKFMKLAKDGEITKEQLMDLVFLEHDKEADIWFPKLMGSGAKFPEHLDLDNVESLVGDRWDENAFVALANERGEITKEQLIDYFYVGYSEKRKTPAALSKVATLYLILGVVSETCSERKITGALIRKAGDIEILAVSDEKGEFEITTLQEDIILHIECDGFAPSTCRSKAPHGSTLRPRLLPISNMQTIDSTANSLIGALDGSWTVRLPANSLTFEDGSPFSGEAKVSVTLLDACDPMGVASMPGDFSAITADGKPAQLQTFGAMWVGAAATNGRSLQIAPGRKMNLNFRSSTKVNVNRLPTGVLPSAWSFDAARCVWVDESGGAGWSDRGGGGSPNAGVMVFVDSIPLKDNSSMPAGTKGGPKKMSKMKKKPAGDKEWNGYETYSVDEFSSYLADSTKREWSMSVSKVGWWNIDSPYLAVMVTGQLEFARSLAPGDDLSSTQPTWGGVTVVTRGVDYSGLTHGKPDESGVFFVMAQFQSSIMVDVTVDSTSSGEGGVGAGGGNRVRTKISFGPFATGDTTGATVDIGPLVVPLGGGKDGGGVPV